MSQPGPAVDRLTVPALWAHPVRTGIGQIRHLLKQERTLEVLDVDEVRVSPRRAESLFVVSSGERLVVTERRNCQVPVSADGVSIRSDIASPVVGIISRRPRKKVDLRPYANCHVIVATMSSLAQGTASNLLDDLALLVDTLVVDEAHHIAAKTWRGFREASQSTRVLQFTATPFRRDGELVDGDVIYSYPLRRAQTDGYFKPITFSAIHEIDPEDSDRAIAERDATVVANIADLRVSNALERLYSEDADWNHLLSEFSSQAVKEHKELIDFLNASDRLDG